MTRTYAPPAADLGIEPVPDQSMALRQEALAEGMREQQRADAPPTLFEPEVYRGRLLRLVFFLEGLPDERFDMTNWYSNDTGEPCGTVACALGWACEMPEFIEQGLTWEDEYPFYSYEITEGPNAGARGSAIEAYAGAAEAGTEALARLGTAWPGRARPGKARRGRALSSSAEMR